jgi:hypothetical protein
LVGTKVGMMLTSLDLERHGETGWDGVYGQEPNKATAANWQ